MKAKYYRPIAASILLTACFSISASAQRVGIGTSNPLRKLAVTGSIMVDQNSNNTGTLDSAALVFGNAGLAGISSRQNGAAPHDLTFWTGNNPSMHLSATGNLGIGAPSSNSYRLHVEGDTKLDGSLNVDEDVFVWGNIRTVGRIGIGISPDPLFSLRVAGSSYLSGNLTSTGNIAFGGDVDEDYRLRVWNGNSRFGGDLYATGNAAFGGAVDPDYRLKIYGGNSLLDGDLRATGKMSIGGSVDNNFRFRVYGGNSRFGGNVEITGDVTASNVDISNGLTIGGNGSVRSNGPSSLRIGFNEKTVDILVPADNAVTVTANISDFSGDNDDVRVSLNQIDLLSGNTLFSSNISIIITEVDPVADTCTLRIRNLSNSNATLKATIYLTTIAKN